MRRRLHGIAVLLALALATPGCFVLDELDGARAPIKGKKAEAAKEEAAPAEPEPSKTSAVQAKVKNLWRNARTPTSKEETGDPADALISCDVSGKLHFTTRSDCALRGGTAR